MPFACSAYGCSNRQQTGGELHFFGYPLKNVQLLQQWVNAVRREAFVPTKYSKLCSTHFQESDYLVRPGTYHRHLKPDAVPSIFPGFPEHYQPQGKKRIPRNSETGCSSSKQLCIANVTQGTSDMQDMHIVNVHADDSTSQFVQTTLTMTDINDTGREIAKLKAEIRTLRQKVRRRDASMIKMRSLLSIMKEKGIMEGEAESILLSHFEGLSLELFNNELKNGNTAAGGSHRYTQELKRFALTLHFYSPRAYRFCRTILTLPHPSALSNWISSVNADVGFFTEVFKALTDFPLKAKKCVLMLDGMAINKRIIWERYNHQAIGYCDYGNGCNMEAPDNEATEALVFMLVSIFGTWKWPIGYVLHSSMNTNVLKELIQTAINLSRESGVRVLSITFDGTHTNMSTMAALGCNFQGRYDEITPKFKDEYSNDIIYATPDACHMLKLARNALATYKNFYSSEGNVISWQHVLNLHTIQEGIGLRFGNKLSKAHIEWHKNKMKVRYAAQTLSASTADALKFLMEMKVVGFEHCGETIKFIQCVDQLFDFLNSRNPFATGYKKPISLKNYEYVAKSMKKNIEYLYSLKDAHNKFLYEGPRKTFIVGFATTCASLLAITKELLQDNMKYVMTYNFSQDHLEMLFASIRRRFGCNDNPNAQELRTAMKHIILKNAITPSSAGNCIALNVDKTGSIFDITWKKTKHDEEVNEGDDDEQFEDNFLSTTILKDNILYYICGFIVRKLRKRVNCVDCVHALIDWPSSNEHNYNHGTQSYAKLLQVKNNGGLISASSDVFKIIKFTETKLFQETQNFIKLKSNENKKIRIKLRNSMVSKNIFINVNCEDDMFSSHRIKLIDSICKFYMDIRLFDLSKKLAAVSKRHMYKKLTLFGNQ